MRSRNGSGAAPAPCSAPCAMTGGPEPGQVSTRARAFVRPGAGFIYQHGIANGREAEP
jgi:hypothetical protein